MKSLEAKANTDLPTLLSQHSQQSAFVGNITIMTMLDNDRTRIETERVPKVQAGMTTRGYVYHSNHLIPPHVDWDTYRLIIDLLDRCADYTA